MVKEKSLQRSILLLFMFTFHSLNAFTWPIDVGQYSAPITSPFGPRMYPYGYYDFHPGVDIRTQNSTTVVAVHEGYVDWLGTNGGYERMIFIGEAAYSYATGYAHLASYSVEIDDIVFEGNTIATAGSNHLHFNYYTRNVWEEFSQGGHPHDGDTAHPLNILPYTNYYDPDVPAESVSVGGTNSDVHSVGFDIEIDDDELDLKSIELMLWAEGHNHVHDFDARTNIDVSDGYDNTQSVTVDAWPYGEILVTFTVYDFEYDPDDNQVMGIQFDFSSYTEQIYASDIDIWIYDVMGSRYWLTGFSAGL